MQPEYTAISGILRVKHDSLDTSFQPSSCNTNKNRAFNMKKYSIFNLVIISITFLSSLAVADSTLDSINQRLQVLEDKENIRTLLQNYGRYVDDRNWEAFSTLFASKTGTWDGGMGVAKGKKEIIEMMQSTIGSKNTNTSDTGLSNLHLLSNEIITVNDDVGEAISKWVFVMTAAEGGPNVVFIGRYLDQLIRENNQWKFQKRKVLSDISTPMQLDGLNND